MKKKSQTPFEIVKLLLSETTLSIDSGQRGGGYKRTFFVISSIIFTYTFHPLT